MADSAIYNGVSEEFRSAYENALEPAQVVEMYDHMTTVIRDALRTEGLESVAEEDLEKEMKDRLISTSKLIAKDLTLFKNVCAAKKDFDAGKLTKTGIEKARKEYKELVNHVVELMQRSRARELERAKWNEIQIV